MQQPEAGVGVQSMATPAPLERRQKRESQLPYYLYRAAEAVVRFLPRRASYSLATFVAYLMTTLSPWSFRFLRENIRHVRPGISRRQMRGIVRRNLRYLCHSWVDVMAMRYAADSINRLKAREGMEYADAAFASGRGVVVVSMHFGPWEAALGGFNQAGGKMALLAEELHPLRLFKRIVGSRSLGGAKIIPLDVQSIRDGDLNTARRRAATAIREVIRHLKDGGFIAIAIDRDLMGNGEPIRFFDQDAPIPLGATDVAIRTGSIILPVALVRQRGDTYAARVFEPIEYDASAPRDSEVRRTTRAILELFEPLIREHPEQWHVMEPVWRPLSERDR